MDKKAKEAFGIFCEALLKLEERSKGLSEIRSRFEGTIEECKKNKEEVKTKKVKVPFILPKIESPIDTEKENAREIRKRGRRKAAEKAIARNTVQSKTTLKRKLRKRTSDGDLVEEQPLSERPREITDVKDIESDTTKKVLKETKTTQKGSVLNIIPDNFEEIDNNNPSEINKPSVNDKTYSNHIQASKEDETLTGKINKSSETIKHGVEKSVSNKIGEDKSCEIIGVNQKSANCKSPGDKTITIDSNARNGVLPDNTKDNSIEMTCSAVSKTFKIAVTTESAKNNIVESTEIITGLKSITNLVVESSDLENSDVSMEKENTVKDHQNNEISKNNLTKILINPLSSKEKLDCEIDENMKPSDSMKQNNLTRKETVKGNDFAVSSQPLPSVLVSRAPTIILSSDEESPVKKKFTRSKAAPKEKKNIPQNSDLSSNEESPVKQKLTRSKIVHGKENRIVTASSESTPSSSDEKTVPQTRVTRSKMAKPKEAIETNLNSNPSTPTDEESAPLPQVRMTRSKMAKPKVDKINATSRSGEESDTRSELTSCSDSESGKKKVKDIVKMFNDKQPVVLLSPVKLTKDQEKENQYTASLLKMIARKEKRTPSVDRRLLGTKTTPLAVRNGYITPNKKPITVLNSTSKNKSVMDVADQRRKEEEARCKRLKEEEVIRKKQERLKIKQEELKKKTVEKLLKAAATREAAEKEKNKFISRLEKEREEREKLAKAEAERKKAEEVLKKKVANQAKAAEVETRRLKEEAARLARLKEMEEEQRHQEELRQKQQEENERNMKIRQEDLRAKEALKQKTFQQKELLKKQQKTYTVHNITKDKDNYSISADLEADEDDDEEEDDKKEIPTWAKKEERLLPSKIQVYYPIDRVMELFCCPSSSPDLTDIFGKMTMKRIRSSSAVWLDSPPIKVHHTINNL